MGNLRQPSPVFHWRADTIGVWDRVGESVSLFAGDGEYVREVSMTLDTEARGFARGLAATGNGLLLWTERYSGDSASRSATSNVLWRYAGGLAIDSIAAPLGSSQLVVRDVGWSARFDGLLPRKTHILFSDAHGTLIVNSGSPEVLLVDTAFRARPLFALTGISAEMVSASTIRTYRDSVLVSLQALFADSTLRNRRHRVDPRHIRDLVDDLPMPATYPLFAFTLVDDRDRLWLQSSSGDRRRIWRVYDLSAGKLLETVIVSHTGTVFAGSVVNGALVCLEVAPTGKYVLARYE
jgi:hypothetical protein